MNGAIYLTRRETLLQERNFYGQRPRAYVMPRERSLDIDDEFDFVLAEYIHSRFHQNLSIVTTRTLHGVGKFRAVMHHRDPDARATVGRFHEPRVGKRKLTRLVHGARLDSPVFTFDDTKRRHVEPVILEQTFHDCLVHTQRGAQNAATHIWHVGQLTQTL